MTGTQVAESLGVADKAASNEITKVQALIADGRPGFFCDDISIGGKSFSGVSDGLRL